MGLEQTVEVVPWEDEYAMSPSHTVGLELGLELEMHIRTLLRVAIPPSGLRTVILEA